MLCAISLKFPQIDWLNDMCHDSCTSWACEGYRSRDCLLIVEGGVRGAVSCDP